MFPEATHIDLFHSGRILKVLANVIATFVMCMLPALRPVPPECLAHTKFSDLLVMAGFSWVPFYLLIGYLTGCLWAKAQEKVSDIRYSFSDDLPCKSTRPESSNWIHIFVILLRWIKMPSNTYHFVSVYEYLNEITRFDGKLTFGVSSVFFFTYWYSRKKPPICL